MEEERKELFDKLLNLEKRLSSVNADKKSNMRGYNDQIKDIKADIKEVVEELGGE